MGLKTLQEVASSLKEPVSRVSYMVLKYNIPYCRKAGRVRLFDEEQVALIKMGCFNIVVKKGN